MEEIEIALAQRSHNYAISVRPSVSRSNLACTVRHCKQGTCRPHINHAGLHGGLLPHMGQRCVHFRRTVRRGEYSNNKVPRQLRVRCARRKLQPNTDPFIPFSNPHGALTNMRNYLPLVWASSVAFLLFFVLCKHVLSPRLHPAYSALPWMGQQHWNMRYDEWLCP